MGINREHLLNCIPLVVSPNTGSCSERNCNAFDQVHMVTRLFNRFLPYTEIMCLVSISHLFLCVCYLLTVLTGDEEIKLSPTLCFHLSHLLPITRSSQWPLQRQNPIWATKVIMQSLKLGGKKTGMVQSSSPPITAVDMVNLHALHGICHPSLAIHKPAEWVRQCMPISAQYFHEHTGTRWEEVTLIYFHRRAARRQRGATLDRESHTLQIVTTLVTVSIPFMSQRGGSLSLSPYLTFLALSVSVLRRG